MKKFVSFLVCFLMAATVAAPLAGCKGSHDILIWTFTKELSTMIKDYYAAVDPNTNIKVEEYEVNVLVTKLDNAVKNKKEVPDIVALEEKILRGYVDSGLLASLQDLVGEDTKNMYPYTLNVTKDANNEVTGLAWQATPGAIYYRRSMAKEILGVNTPEEMQAKMDTWEHLLETADQLKRANTENFKNVKIFSSVSAPARLFYSQRENGWVSNNTLNVDPILYEIDTTKQKYSLFMVTHALQRGISEKEFGGADADSYTKGSTEWDTQWFSDMSSNDVFAYLLPSYSLHYSLKPNATSTSGASSKNDWGIIQGPGIYSDGGTWLSVLKSSPNMEKSKEIIKYFTTNTDFLNAWVEATGDFVNNKPLMEAKKGDAHSEEFLGGQNQYDILCDIAAQLQGNNLSAQDSFLNSSFNECAINYAKGDYEAVGALEMFKDAVRSKYTKITVN